MKEIQNTEWKESWRDDYLRWVCGFEYALALPLLRGEKWGEKWGEKPTVMSSALQAASA